MYFSITTRYLSSKFTDGDIFSDPLKSSLINTIHLGKSHNLLYVAQDIVQGVSRCSFT